MAILGPSWRKNAQAPWHGRSYAPAVAVSIDTLAVSLSDLRAFRWSTDAVHVGLKTAYAIARIERGTSEWSLGNARWTSRPGSLQLLTPGDVCRDVPNGASTRHVIMLPASMVERAVGRMRPQPQLDVGDVRGLPFHRLHDAVQRGADCVELGVALEEAIAALAGIGAPRNDHTRPVRRAMSLLRESVTEHITLERLAEHADLEKFRLCRAFRAQVGLPPHAYLTRLRVQRAQELLAAGVKASEVAPRVGFYDQSQLHRHFRRIVGITPGAYARRCCGRRAATANARTEL